MKLHHRNILIFLIATILLFVIASGSVEELTWWHHTYFSIYFFGVPLWILRGIFRYMFVPAPENSKNFNLVERITWLEDKQEMSERKKYRKELDYLVKKYGKSFIEKEKKAQKKLDDLQEKRRDESAEKFRIGKKASKIICPHCKEKGSVYKKENTSRIDSTRETGVGAIIGRKTLTSRKVTQMHCKACGTTWDV